MDFNTLVDRLRLVGANDQNFRVNVNAVTVADFDPNASGTWPDRNINYADVVLIVTLVSDLSVDQDINGVNCHLSPLWFPVQPFCLRTIIWSVCRVCEAILGGLNPQINTFLVHKSWAIGATNGWGSDWGNFLLISLFCGCQSANDQCDWVPVRQVFPDIPAKQTQHCCRNSNKFLVIGKL